MSTVDTREHQMFPVLSPSQIEMSRRFASGPETRFEAGEKLFAIGDCGAPAWLVVDGSIDVVRRDGLSREAVVTTHRAGQFSGEVNQLAGRPSIAAGRAGPDGCTALPFDPAHLRALMVGSADVGELVMRALILRRVGLIEEGGAGTILVGVPGSPDVLRLQDFLGRERLRRILVTPHSLAYFQRSLATSERLSPGASRPPETPRPALRWSSPAHPYSCPSRSLWNAGHGAPGRSKCSAGPTADPWRNLSCRPHSLRR